LLKLGFDVSRASVAKYMVKRCGPPSQGWRTFLRNHAPDIAAIDLFVVPTIGFDLLYALVIVRLVRRDLVRINVTTHPTAEWIARQITEAFPWNEAPRYLIRDRDQVYGAAVMHRFRAMGIRDKPIAPGSPWQNGFAERLIGSIRRECVDQVVVLGEAHLRRILTKYAAYYNELRTHRSLNKDAPIHRAIQHVGPPRICAHPWRPSSPLLPNLVFGTHTAAADVNANDGISGPEKKAQKRPADCSDAVSENEPSHTSPPIRGLSYTFRKSPVACDWMVVDAARIEPVSTLKFPASREFSREFFEKAPPGAILESKTRAASIAYDQIPCSTEQGIFLQEQGILSR
jgi:hypothetical protein